MKNMLKTISSFVTNVVFLKISFLLLVIAIFSVIGLGVYTLHTSPYTGLTLKIDKEKWVVSRNDLNDMAFSSDILIGDRVDYFEDIGVEKEDFIRLPEFSRKWQEKKWWVKQKSYFKLLQNTKTLSLKITRRHGVQNVVNVNVLPNMPLLQIVKRNIFIYLSAIFAIGIGVISFFRRRSSPFNILCAFFAGSGALYLVSVAPVANRDLSLPSHLFYLFLLGCFIGAGGLITLVHFSLVFPKKNPILTKHPDIIYLLYVYAFTALILYLTGICSFGAFFPFIIIWTLILTYAFIHSWINEKDVFLKKIIGTSLIIPVACSFVFVFINLLPTFIGLPPLDPNYFALISFLIPFSLFFCIENYTLYNEKTKSEQGRQKDRDELRRDLHNNTTEDLYLIMLYCERTIDKYLPDNIKKIEEYIRYIRDKADDSSREIRGFLNVTDPKYPTWNDYILFLKEHSSSILDPMGVELTFQDPHIDENIPDPDVTFKYRLFQIYKVAICNIVRHAKAGNVIISITVSQGKVELNIKDDGIGFDSSKKTDRGHLGIEDMYKTAKMIKGVLVIEPPSGEGTIINLKVPIE